MKREQFGIVRGSGNIYQDFDLPDADVRQLKAILAAEIVKALDKKSLSMRKAQSLVQSRRPGQPARACWDAGRGQREEGGRAVTGCPMAGLMGAE